MDIGERIKKVRKELNLTQQNLADKISIKQNSVALIELGKRNPSEQTLSLICREFRVNEEWLRSGVGEMFLKSDGTILSELADEFNLNDSEKELITAFLNLTDEQRELILKAICDAADRIRNVEKPAHKDVSVEENSRTKFTKVDVGIRPPGLSDDEWEALCRYRISKDTPDSAVM